MARKRFTTEQIIGLLREAEVRHISPYLTDRYSDRAESVEELSQRVSLPNAANVGTSVASTGGRRSSQHLQGLQQV